MGCNKNEDKKRQLSIPLVIKGLLDKRTSNQIKLSREYAERHNYYDKMTAALRNLKMKHELFDQWKSKILYPWQYTCLKKLMSQGTREILWVIGTEGNNGKTYLANFLNILYDFFLLDGGISTRDICHLIKDNVRGFCFDISRASLRNFDYSTLEALKNGYAVSGKYAGKLKRFRNAPVVVFSNNFPDVALLSI